MTSVYLITKILIKIATNDVGYDFMLLRHKLYYGQNLKNLKNLIININMLLLSKLIALLFRLHFPKAEI